MANNIISITEDGYIVIYSPDISFDDPFIKSLLERYNGSLIIANGAKPLFKYIPDTIKKLRLEFEDYSDIKLNNLYNSLKELYISIFDLYRTDFNKPINNLPLELENLNIESETFNQSLDYLPQGLKHLSIKGLLFNKPVNNLPSSLEYIELNTFRNRRYILNYNYDLLSLPENIKHIKVHERYLKFNSVELLKERYPLANLEIIYDEPQIIYKQSFLDTNMGQWLMIIFGCGMNMLTGVFITLSLHKCT